MAELGKMRPAVKHDSAFSATTNKDKSRAHESNINCNPVKKKEEAALKNQIIA